MSKENTSQNMFLDYILKKKVNVLIFLVNGIKLAGKVTDFDQYSLVLNNTLIDKHNSILIYKHAISTIVPQKDVELTNE